MFYLVSVYLSVVRPSPLIGLSVAGRVERWPSPNLVPSSILLIQLCCHGTCSLTHILARSPSRLAIAKAGRVSVVRSVGSPILAIVYQPVSLVFGVGASKRPSERANERTTPTGLSIKLKCRRTCLTILPVCLHGAARQDGTAARSIVNSKISSSHSPRSDTLRKEGGGRGRGRTVGRKKLASSPTIPYIYSCMNGPLLPSFLPSLFSTSRRVASS